MQVGEPVNHLVDHARTGVRLSQRLNPVSKVLNQIGAAEVDPAYGKQEDDAKAPESEHAVQAPDHTLLSGLPPDGQASPPRPDPWPPNHNSRQGDPENQHRGEPVDLPAGL